MQEVAGPQVDHLLEARNAAFAAPNTARRTRPIQLPVRLVPSHTSSSAGSLLSHVGEEQRDHHKEIITGFKDLQWNDPNG